MENLTPATQPKITPETETLLNHLVQGVVALLETKYVMIPRPVKDEHLEEWQVEIIARIQASDRIAYRLREAAELLGISRATLWREIKRGKISVMARLRRISREELLRYAREETQLSSRKRRVPRSQYKPVPKD